jgi:hypothetical protein
VSKLLIVGWLAISAAPGGAALVQDFLKAKAIEEHPDLLTDSVLAQAWVTDAARAW